MKIIKIITCTAAALAVLILASQARAMSVLYAQTVMPVSATQPTHDQGFEASQEWAKLTQPVKDAWTSARNAGDMDQKLECFVRVQAPFDLGDADFLQSNGFNVITTGGNIVRGSVKAANLQAVAKLPFVLNINLATKKK